MPLLKAQALTSYSMFLCAAATGAARSLLPPVVRACAILVMAVRRLSGSVQPGRGGRG
jgi:hypothetical protein